MGASAVDGICQGIGYTLVLICMCVVRELLGAAVSSAAACWAAADQRPPGITIFPEEFGIKILTMPVGGFLTLGAPHCSDAVGHGQSNAKKEKEAK